MWKDSHQGVKGQAETFKLDPICVLNQTGIQVLGWRGRFKGMQRLKTSTAPHPEFSWTPFPTCIVWSRECAHGPGV